MKQQASEEFPLWIKLLSAGTAACIADLATFPLDTAKVRMQIAGESRPLLLATTDGSMLAMRNTQPGLWRTVKNIVRLEGARSLYGGLSAGLQRQMCFASIRLGLYDGVKSRYAGIIDESAVEKEVKEERRLTDNHCLKSSNNRSASGSKSISVRIAAGITTGALAVLFAQPTDVVKVRLQAGSNGRSVRYSSTLQAYKNIAAEEGTRGLWKGTVPNISRNAIVNVAEIVCYDIIKDFILEHGYLRDGIPCHITAAVAAGLCTTLAASPVDVVKTRYMNSAPGEYKGVKDCAVRMMMKEGPSAFYKGFVPSFTRLVSWNIVLWITYEQFKVYAKKLNQ
ncbi:mitochondrial uncoupling protein 2 isoform X1 [Apis mellifera caucasica]|uniref:Mitochondrial uncoupling protein 2 isoform X1 n=1 Tax=Apis mellifera TaxID=7460 RepID=A0A7M7MMR1_APIME|nr:mitochondrial uncoupling protein 2 isoform X1 [Apis mellifera]KAG6797100.1 mitochondrial uncoupling protein 2 isoform X1 [Apis mellifera caucasica]KAG9438077.1 mitochondrial uncoupling protein 2 isoform X1 [Apis mellifera carnica]|eukprot:XP_026298269.1 mitochondrial uncoupling protein 2 isoform X1 [Apis mellifera]